MTADHYFTCDLDNEVWPPEKCRLYYLLLTLRLIVKRDELFGAGTCFVLDELFLCGCVSALSSQDSEGQCRLLKFRCILWSLFAFIIA